MADSKISQLPDGDSAATISSVVAGAVSGVTKKISISKILSLLDLSDYELLTNKSTNVNTDQASNTKYPSVKAVYDWAVGLFATITMTLKTSCNQAADATVSSGTHTFDCNYGVQKITATGGFTLAFSNIPANVYSTFVIYAVNWGAYSINLPSPHIKNNGIALSFTSSGMDKIQACFDKNGNLELNIIGRDIK